MKRITILLALTLVVALCMPAVAEVEEITVGGSIWVQGEFREPGFGPGGSTPIVDLDGNLATVNDIVNNPLNPTGPTFTNALSGFDEDASSEAWYSQRTRVNVDATLSGGVRAFVELQAYDFWGDDIDDGFLSESSTESGNDIVSLYQAYIDMNNIADYPVMLRIGRQELSYGREYLIGNNDAGKNFSGLSFDAVKLVYTDTDNSFQIDAWASKLFEGNSPLGAGLQDEDIDFYGVYGTYTGIENTVLDAYLLLVRDPSSTRGTEVDYLYTIGGRGAGIVDIGAGEIDYNAEIAFQFGDTSANGDYEAWTINLMAGYTFTDVQWTPRLEAEYAYFSGDDNLLDRDTESFTRLFSDVHYGELNLGGTLDALATNLHILRIGGSAVPVEKLTVSADFYLFWLAEDDSKGGAITFGNIQVGAPLLGPISAAGSDDSVGYELDIVGDYQYTEDLNLRFGWTHFFADDAIENSFGGQDDDVDYLFVQATLDF